MKHKESGEVRKTDGLDDVESEADSLLEAM
jgi:hypothetical protein